MQDLCMITVMNKTTIATEGDDWGHYQLYNSSTTEFKGGPSVSRSAAHEGSNFLGSSCTLLKGSTRSHGTPVACRDSRHQHQRCGRSTVMRTYKQILNRTYLQDFRHQVAIRLSVNRERVRAGGSINTDTEPSWCFPSFRVQQDSARRPLYSELSRRL